MLTVHPRVRGERRTLAASVRAYVGSSPRARGTRQRHHTNQPADRFIPACAGNATVRQSQIMDSAVHPRVRGER